MLNWLLSWILDVWNKAFTKRKRALQLSTFLELRLMAMWVKPVSWNAFWHISSVLNPAYKIFSLSFYLNLCFLLDALPSCSCEGGAPPCGPRWMLSSALIYKKHWKRGSFLNTFDTPPLWIFLFTEQTNQPLTLGEDVSACESSLAFSCSISKLGITNPSVSVPKSNDRFNVLQLNKLMQRLKQCSESHKA